MKVENVTPKPYEKSIFPGISFDVEISYRKYQEAIAGINGWLESDDKKIIAEIKEGISEAQRDSSTLAARDSGFDGNFDPGSCNVTLVTLLDRKALSYIENRRMKDRRGDVKLNLNLKVKSINSRAAVCHVHEVEPAKAGLHPVKIPTGRVEKEGSVLIYANDPGFYSNRTNRWILSGDGSPIFLDVREQVLRKEGIEIGSSYWIHDYAPKLELGEYFIVEIPKGRKIVEDAWNYIGKAEECFRNWATKGVYAHCREIGNLLDRTIKEKFGKDSFIYGERWGRTYGRFEHFASLDLHLEGLKSGQKYSPEEVNIDKKADAEHILIVTKALIKYVEELLREYEKQSTSDRLF